ncbi:MAG TPA: glycosyltransferase family A protein [Candidatus Methylomirabilis sp.]|nr:glycosyltransferase family A protein [Candidatus Methylomirabilis sp.]
MVSGRPDQPDRHDAAGPPRSGTPWSVSCIVPVFNGEEYLAQALDSIFAQTLPALEVLVVDDGSSDGTPDIARGYADRVVYLRVPHAGQSAARNHGIRAARGDLVAFLDADDLAHPTKLARQAARFEARPDLHFSRALVLDFWTPELPVELRPARELPGPHPGPVSTWLVRREVFQRIGGFEPTMRFGEAAEWYHRARESGVVIDLLAEVVAYRRLHRHNMTRGHREEQVDSLFTVIQAAMERKRRQS